MKHVLVVICSLLISMSAFSKTFSCEDVVDESMRIIVSFDSSVPNFEYKAISYNDDGSIQSERLKRLLSLNTACGAKIDFKNDCSFKEKNNGSGYSFEFVCSVQNIKGTLYISENNYVEFRCDNEPNPSVFCLK